MTDKKGTGKVLGEIEVNNELSFKIKDDGCNDPDIYIEIIANGYSNGTGPITIPMRRQNEEQFLQDVADVANNQQNLFLP